MSSLRETVNNFRIVIPTQIAIFIKNIYNGTNLTNKSV